MKYLLSPVLLLLALAPGCRVPGGGRDAGVASAPESVAIDGRTFRLEAALWRDFQPVAPPDGQPLMAVVQVVAEDSLPLPEGITIGRVWVLSGREQWAPALSELPEKLTVHLADGPKWGPGISVDVVARLDRGRENWLVRAADRPIKRTD